MATATREHNIYNPAHRKFSAKQIRAGFGGKRRLAALKTKKRHAHAKPKAKAKNKSHRPAKHRAQPKRGNPGEQILSITLPNTGGKRSTMAHAKKKNAKHYSAPHKKNPGHHKERSNPKHHSMKHYKRNPSSGGVMGVVTSSVFAGAGLVLSRLATQVVLGASNTGIMGYGGNAIATGLLAWLTHAVSKNPRNRDMVVVGGVLGILARMISDFTPYGAWLARYGVGDYGMGVYLPSNFVTPQRYANALNSAQVEIPAGWAPTVNVQAASAGVGGVYGGGGMRALY
jgi:hypothetical protein